MEPEGLGEPCDVEEVEVLVQGAGEGVDDDQRPRVLVEHEGLDQEWEGRRVQKFHHLNLMRGEAHPLSGHFCLYYFTKRLAMCDWTHCGVSEGSWGELDVRG